MGNLYRYIKRGIAGNCSNARGAPVYNILGWFTDIHYQNCMNVYVYLLKNPKPVFSKVPF